MSYTINRRRLLALGSAMLLTLAGAAQAASALDGVSYPDMSGKPRALSKAWGGKVVVMNFWDLVRAVSRGNASAQPVCRPLWCRPAGGGRRGD